MSSRLSGHSALTAASLLAALFAGASSALLGICGPFTDVSDAGFCPFVLEIFTLGITTGTTPTTFDPASPVTRLQMAAFLSRTVDGVVSRGRRRAALNRNWTSQNDVVIPTTTVGNSPAGIQSDGADLWVAVQNSGSIARVRASDGRLIESWTGATFPLSVLVALGRVLAQGAGNLYLIDPRQPAGTVTTVASNLGSSASLTFDGARVWICKFIGPNGVLAIATPGGVIPWTVTTVSAGFTVPYGLLFDGKNVWVTDMSDGVLLKLDSAGAVLQTVTVGSSPTQPGFDQTNIWVPNSGSDSVTVVRASSGAVLRTLTGNGLNHPFAVAFDGERILVTNPNGASVSLWKAADLTPLGTFPTGPGTNPTSACSDGTDFWISLGPVGRIARF